ncbi:MAG: polyphosphate polymerase domain-containing protein [Prevotellaceae bacterium]|jgi:hypothetical protein|nr:polyphosphate polymerase domain-containing protein [Prevotellaceae bacterium]
MNTPTNNAYLEAAMPSLSAMQTITLDEMKNIHLMDRVDSKFVTNIALLPYLLEEMLPYFKVQITNNSSVAPYATQYFDTPDLGMFLMHHNGKLNRQKIRIRSYIDSNLSFLEIKNKNNKGRTSKKRIRVQASHIDSIDDLKEDKNFLNENSLFSSDSLVPVLANNFNRMTFVNTKATERITIDVNLSFQNYITGNKSVLENLMILELKQDGLQHSDFREILSRLRIRSSSFSKYCMGTFLTNANVKSNRMKGKWAKVSKLLDK